MVVQRVEFEPYLQQRRLRNSCKLVEISFGSKNRKVETGARAKYF